jgi:uncharacterized membrane protein YebE (DUF533 family)
MYKEMSCMTAKQLALVKSMTLAAYADGHMKYDEKQRVLLTMKRVLADRIMAKLAIEKSKKAA